MSFFDKIKKMGSEVVSLGKLKKDLESKKFGLYNKLKEYSNKEEFPEFLKIALKEIEDLEMKINQVGSSVKNSGKNLFEEVKEKAQEIKNKSQDNKVEDNKIEDNKIEDNKIEDNKIKDNKVEDNKIEDNKVAK